MRASSASKSGWTRSSYGIPRGNRRTPCSPGLPLVGLVTRAPQRNPHVNHDTHVRRIKLLVRPPHDSSAVPSGQLPPSVRLTQTVPLPPARGRAKRHAREPIDLRKICHYPIDTFWETIRGPMDDGIILRPDEFYIMATKERVRVPASTSAEMVAYDTTMGEFRVHYAGFFDPGFGWAEAGGEGTRAVLEVRSHDVPFLLDHGQTVGRLVYERLTEVPSRLYGIDIGSTYQRQGLALAKHFRR